MRGIARVTLAALALVVTGMAANAHPLLDYINQPDSAYSWRRQQEYRLEDNTKIIRVHMVSQVWQGAPWKHQLTLIRPTKLANRSTVLLVVVGGHEQRKVLPMVAHLAGMVALPIAILYNIPNEPLFNKEEDDLIAYSLVQYLKTGDPTWPLLYPMAKSVVRAMDTIQAVAAQRWHCPATGFVVTGASKRAWTTWLSAAADRRIIGIAPMVYDNLNIPAQMQQQLRVYSGTYSEHMDAYTSEGLPQMLKGPDGQRLVQMVDPYVLRERITMPKLIVNASNDEYWTLGSANLYYNGLVGAKHVLYVPNASHGLRDLPRIAATLGAFARSCAARQRLPAIHWSYEETPEGLRLTLRPSHSPSRVLVWTAASATADFRKVRWQAHTATRVPEGYTFVLPKPAAGYAALFGEVRTRDRFGPFTLSSIPQMTGSGAPPEPHQLAQEPPAGPAP